MNSTPILSSPRPPAREFRIDVVRAADGVADVRVLLQDYAASHDVDLGGEGFEAELAALPGDYAPPAGELLLARDRGGGALGCIALRSLGPGSGEIKRLYVCPPARGLGLGRALVTAICAVAEGLGYREIKLDTLPSLTAAAGLYGAMGFEPIPNYGANRYPGLLCFGKTLAGASLAGGRP